MNTNKTTEPKTLQEAILYFADPARALAYMKPLVWPSGVVCPHCGIIGEHPFIASRSIWRCHDCKKQFSIKMGTVMEESPLGLDKWLGAMWLIANAKNGISSYEIHRALGITQKSAWFLLHRIRLAMQTGSFHKMSGTVEADESYVGGALKNLQKRKIKALREKHARPDGTMRKLANDVNKTVVMGMLERGQDGKPSQARMELINSAHGRHLHSVIRENVALGASLMTDSLKGYTMLREDYVHQAVNHAIEYVRGEVHTNGLENFWSLMKRTLKGTYVAVELFHMMRYLDEQCFRFNNRKLTDAGRMVKTVSGVVGKRLMYKALIGKDGETHVV